MIDCLKPDVESLSPSVKPWFEENKIELLWLRKEHQSLSQKLH